MKTTQKNQILKALRDGDTLTPLDALRRFGCMRLAARIQELRQDGLSIATTRAAEGIAVYWLMHRA